MVEPESLAVCSIAKYCRREPEAKRSCTEASKTCPAGRRIAHIYTKVLVSVYFLLLAKYLHASDKFMMPEERAGALGRTGYVNLG
jgi:hypothetical protein